MIRQFEGRFSQVHIIENSLIGPKLQLTRLQPLGKPSLSRDLRTPPPF